MNKIRQTNSFNFNNMQIKNHYSNSSLTENKQLEEKLHNDLLQKAEIGKSQINFRGKFLNLNKNDLLFLSTIVSGLGLSAACFDKLKETLGNFLEKNNFKSMSDITSDNHTHKQRELADTLGKVIGINEDNKEEKTSYLVNRITERCNSGEEYSPTRDINDENKDLISNQYETEEDEFFSENLKNAYKQFVEDDKKLIETIKTTFNLDEKQTKRLNEMIQNLLYDFGYFTLKQLNIEENMEDIGILSDNITSEFELNEHDSLLLSSEILKRIIAIRYIPSINPLDRDMEQAPKDRAIFQQVLNKYNIQPAFYNILYREMKQDAYEAGYSSTLDIFKQGKDIANYKRTIAVLNLPEFKDIRTDLIIDFNIAVKNEASVAEEVKMKAKKDTERYKKESVLLTLINEQYNLSMDDLKILRHHFSEKKYDYEKDLWKAAYEISEKLNIETKIIADIIKKINTMSKEEIEMGNFNFIKVLMEKTK